MEILTATSGFFYEIKLGEKFMPYLAKKRHTTVSPSQVTRESKTHRSGGFFILEEIQARLRFREKYKTASISLRGFAF